MLSAHHIIFRSQDGDDALSNLITLCFNCHRIAHDGKYRNEEGERVFVNARVWMIEILEKIKNPLFEEALESLLLNEERK